MLSNAPRTEPRPVEAFLINSTLESTTSQGGLMDPIQRLSQERSQLQADLARSPWGSREAARRIWEITNELDACWAEVRRSRAVRRVRLEEALGVDPAACQEAEDPAADEGARLPARRQQSKRRHHPLPMAS